MPPLLELASELGNASKACRLMSYSRQQFYEIRRNYQLYGAEDCSIASLAPRGLIPIASCRMP